MFLNGEHYYAQHVHSELSGNIPAWWKLFSREMFSLKFFNHRAYKHALNPQILMYLSIRGPSLHSLLATAKKETSFFQKELLYSFIEMNSVENETLKLVITILVNCHKYYETDSFAIIVRIPVSQYTAIVMPPRNLPC